ncbi:MAG: RNA polymerase sigma factor [Chitinophagales bacterium]|nr:RNA polymerase sigma factor [Chitinophagales bacterium]MDW8418746.1 RNA polymerase sigma factor [Chitinophagales bacterium]
MAAIVYQGYTEQQIREGCVRGERKFQQMLYDMFSPKMFAVCLRYAPDYNTAQDLLQEGFVKVFRNIERFRGDGSFEGWVRRIFINTAIEHFRKQTNLYAIHDSDVKGFEYYHQSALESLKEQDILNMIQQLSDGYRTVFNLYVIEGYSHKDIGEMLGISEGTSKSQLARARYLLQKMITEHEQKVNDILKA